MGNLNHPMDKPTELQKTRIMKAWIDPGKVMLLNDPKVHTRIDPVTGRGSTLDLAIVNPSLMSKVVHFKVDTYRRWSLHGTITSKSTGRIQMGKWSDHKSHQQRLSSIHFQFLDFSFLPNKNFVVLQFHLLFPQFDPHSHPQMYHYCLYLLCFSHSSSCREPRSPQQWELSSWVCLSS